MTTFLRPLIMEINKLSEEGIIIHILKILKFHSIFNFRISS